MLLLRRMEKLKKSTGRKINDAATFFCNSFNAIVDGFGIKCFAIAYGTKVFYASEGSVALKSETAK